MAGINLFLNDQARQTILRLKNEQATTQVKILANQFLLHYREKEIKKWTDQQLGTVELNEDQNLTIKLKKGNTVKVRFNESGY
ncbi:conjugative coupling factor TraD, SXT/TOL subfamily, traD [Pediococcus acidilactici]